MKIDSRRTLFHALLTSFAIATIPVHAAESQGTYVAASDTTLVELCAATQNGMVPKAQVEKALHRMLDMGDTPEAAKMPKDRKRSMQFDVFWKEFARTSGG